MKEFSSLSTAVFGGGKHGQFKAWEIRQRPHEGVAARACTKFAAEWRRVRVLPDEDDDQALGGGARRCFRSYAVEHLDTPVLFSHATRAAASSEPEKDSHTKHIARILALRGAREQGVGTHLLPQEATDARTFRAGDAVELRERSIHDESADLDGCGGDGGYGDDDRSSDAGGTTSTMPVLPFVWMSRVPGAFANVAKHGPSALLKAADPDLKSLPAGNDATLPVQRMQLSGTLVVAKIDGREVVCRVRRYHSEGVSGGGRFDLRQDVGNDIWNSVPACNVSCYCVRTQDDESLFSNDMSEKLVMQDRLRTFAEIDARRALGLILDEVGEARTPPRTKLSLLPT